MQPEGGAAQTTPHARRRRAQRWFFSAVLGLFVLATVAGFLVARDQAAEDADRQADLAARRAADALETELDDLLTSLAGAAVVVDDSGELDLEVFRSYATDVLSFGRVPGVALVGIVPGDERAAFEVRTGIDLVSIENGSRSPAPPAEVHYPLLDVEPDAPGTPAEGLDYATSPERADAVGRALATRQAAISEPIRLAASQEPAMLLVRPLVYETGAGNRAIVGFAATNLPIDQIDEVVERAVGSDMDVAVTTSDAAPSGEGLLAGEELRPGDKTWRSPVMAADATWDVVVVPHNGHDPTLAILVGLGGTAATVAMALLWLVTVRYQRAMASTNAELALGESRGRAVQEVAGQLARALSTEEVARALVGHLPVAVGGLSVSLAVRNERGSYDLVDSDGGQPSTVDLEGSDSLIEVALVSGEPAWLSSPLAWRHDQVASDIAGEGSALALLPIRTRQVRGILAVSYERVHIFSEQEQSLLRTISILTARALARGHRYDAAREAAVAFQRAALPGSLPEVEDLTIGARYQPAVQQARVGGDWYDLVVLDDRRIALVVGDVVGHGMEAAATMGRLRTAFEVLASLHSDPGEMLRLLSQQVEKIPNAFCSTIACVVIDTESDTLTWSRAGHPPPLLITSEGAELLEGRGLPPLGFRPDLDPPVHRRRIEPGDTIVLYTDGLVERRDEDLDDRLNLLVEVAGNLRGLDPDALCDALVDAMAPSELQTDDLAVLVACHGSPEACDTDAAPTLDLEIPADLRDLPAARVAMRAWLDEHQVVADDASELEVVVSELISNAVEASAADGSIRISARLDDEDSIVLSVANDAGSSVPIESRWDLDDPLRGGGRGLVIVRAFVDDINFDTTIPERTVVRCRRTVARNLAVHDH